MEIYRITMKLLLAIITTVCFLFVTTFAFADDQAITKGLEYLKSKQDDSGKITSGFSAPSQWSTMAFIAHGIDITTVKKSTYSLYDFLRTDIPTNNAATDYETRILAIVAADGDPTNFNGTNYLAQLEGFYTNGQIGDTCSLNDDIFGLLALLASGNAANTEIKQDVLHFLIAKQDADGGFGFSAPGCDWYSTSADMTAAGVQALIKAKENTITDEGLDDAITKAKNYLLTNQNADGGFGYFGSSDTDTTGWVLIGLNALGVKDQEQATKAKTYLLSQQSGTDGGFMTFDWGSNTLVSNATTTAHALIALSGKTWVEHIYVPTVASSAATVTPPAATPTMTPTPTPQSGLISVEQQTIVYQTITVTTTPSPKKIASTSKTVDQTTDNKPAVLGIETDRNDSPKERTITVLSAAAKNPAFLATAIGSLLIALYFWRKRDTVI